MDTISTGLSADKYLLMSPILAVICDHGQRQSSRVPARAVIDVLEVEPASHSFVTVKMGSQVMEMLRADLLQKAVPVFTNRVGLTLGSIYRDASRVNLNLDQRSAAAHFPLDVVPRTAILRRQLWNRNMATRGVGAHIVSGTTGESHPDTA
jgi:hypothetical protein